MAYQSDQDTQSAGKGYFPLFSQSAGRQVIGDKSHPPRYGQCQAGCLSGVKELIKFRSQAVFSSRVRDQYPKPSLRVDGFDLLQNMLKIRVAGLDSSSEFTSDFHGRKGDSAISCIE